MLRSLHIVQIVNMSSQVMSLLVVISCQTKWKIYHNFYISHLSTKQTTKVAAKQLLLVY